MVHAVQDLVVSAQVQGENGRAATYDAHALPSSYQGCNADHETNCRQDSPAPPSVAESDEDSGNDATNNAAEPEAASEDYSWTVAVANGPADEIGVSLVTERPFNGVYNTSERRRMCCICESVQKRSTFLGGQVELARSPIRYVNCNDTGNLFTEWLDGN